jgi:cobalt-zinc-cadmium efflux system protein
MRTAPERALNVALALNATYLVVEAVVGLWSGSLALVSDATHMVADVGALALARYAAHVARRPPTPAHTFGWARAEPLGAFTNALVLTLACGAILFEAGGRLVQGAPPMQAGPVLWVALGGLGVNVVSAFALSRAQRREHSHGGHSHGGDSHGGHPDLNLRAAMLHMAADALGSVAAIAAAGATLLWGLTWADAAASAAIAVLVLVGAWSVLRDSTRVLMQAAPTTPSSAEIEALLSAVPGVEALHDVHVWTLGGGRVVVTAHVVCGRDADERATLDRATRAVRAPHPTAHVTLQLERARPCGQPAAHAPAAHACDASHD